MCLVLENFFAWFFSPYMKLFRGKRLPISGAAYSAYLHGFRFWLFSPNYRLEIGLPISFPQWS